MDKLSVILLVLSALCCCVPSVLSGYLITTSRISRRGATTTLNVNLHDNKGTLNITATIRLANEMKNVVASTSKIFMNVTQGLMEIKVPQNIPGIVPSEDRSEFRAELIIQAFIPGTKESIINETQLITLEKQQNKLFIQTDKPIYKPGQTIRMRVVGIKPDLKPLTGKIERVSIASPSGVRMRQWNNRELKNGIISLKMALSKQPILGNWKIKATFKGQDIEKEFEVSKYVLPKFEVVIEPPPFVAIDSKSVTTTVCSRYTYGQSVSGSLKVTFTIKRNRYSWYSRDEPETIITREIKEAKGCHDFTLTNKELDLKKLKYTYYWSVLNITATMTEEATGVTLPATSTETKFVPYRVKLDFNPGTPRIFKPGLPFYGKLLVTSPDRKPVSNEKVTITAKSYGGRLIYQKTTTVKNGMVFFTIDNVDHKLKYLALDARHGSGKIYDDEYGYSRWYSTAGLYARAWFSKSWSVIALRRISRPLKVGTKARINFDYTVPGNSLKENLVFQMVCGGKMTESGKKVLQFTDSSPITTTPPTTTPTTTTTTTTTTSTRAVNTTTTTRAINTTTTTTNYNTTTNTPTTPEETTASPRGERFWIQPPGYGPLPETKVSDSRPKVSKLNKANDSIEFLVTQTMVPSCRLLVYYIRQDGETVADSMVVDVEDKLENQVFVRFSDDVRRPGEPVQITMTATPGSTVALAGVDKSVRLLKDADDLDTKEIINVLSAQDVGPNTYSPPRRLCEQYDWWSRGPVPLRRKRSYFPYRSDNYVDSSKAFHDSGLVYFSDLTIESRPCPNVWRGRQFGFGFGGGGGVGGGGGPIAAPLSAGGAGGAAGGPLEETADNLVSDRKPKKKSVKPTVRKNFPETWLWTEETVSEADGTRTITAKVPDTITSWHLSGFAMSSSTGMGVADPSTLTVFQPFFVSFTLPYSVIRGEEVSVITTVFNYMNKCATVRIRLTKTDHFELNSTTDHALCICGNEAKSVKYVITPVLLGHIPLTVTVQNTAPSLCANSSDETPAAISDAVTRKLLVEPEGVRKEYTYSSFICPEDGVNKMFHDKMNVSLPDNVVAGSVHATISAIGDLMGPSLSGLDGLLRLPTGCGEQNMVKFAPNIFIMQYLTNSNQLTRSIKKKAIGFLRTGYQRELTYKRKDNSYSAFGDRDEEGSLWLTAFVLRSFSQAREFIFVDDEELNSTFSWIASKQLDTGCFRKHGKLFNKGLKGGVSTPVTLTAYVLISLLESKVNPESKVILKALKCITTQKDTVTDAYSNAIIAYALTLAKHPSRAEFLSRLSAQATVKDGQMYWEKKEKPKKQARFVFWLPPYQRSGSTNIEMTSYALMAMIGDGTDSKAIADAMPIVRWITKQRNSLGGFSSTQDTCVALQGLTKFAGYVYGKGKTFMRIDVGYTRNKRFHHSFRIDDLNRLVLQRVEVPEKILYTKNIPIDAFGEGCALVQADVAYNVPDVEEEPAFELSVRVQPNSKIYDGSGIRPQIEKTEAGEELCHPLEMKVCAKWLEEDKSGMAVIEVKMVSGFSADEESLDRLMNTPYLKQTLMRFEHEENRVVFYFNEIGKNGECLSFGIRQTSVVKKTKPASITVYEYYETDNSATIMYNVTEDLCLIEPPRPTTLKPLECPICPDHTDIAALQHLICKANNVMAVRTVKDGESRFEYAVSHDKLIKGYKPKKKDVHPIDIALPQECECKALKPRTKALLLLREKKLPKNPKKWKLTPKSIVIQRKHNSVNLLRDALKKCSP